MRSMPARTRRVVRPTTRRTVGRFPSLKSKRTIHWESQLERDQIYLLEFDPDVIEFAEQASPITYEIDGSVRRYTPDFFVHRIDGPRVIEVKPSTKAQEEHWQQVFEIAEGYFEAQGVQFVVATEREIQREPRLSNVVRFLRYQRIPVEDQVQQALIAEIAGSGGMATIRTLKATVGGEGVHEAVCALVAIGILNVDLDIPFTTDSPVWVRQGAETCQQ